MSTTRIDKPLPTAAIRRMIHSLGQDIIFIQNVHPETDVRGYREAIDVLRESITPKPDLPAAITEAIMGEVFGPRLQGQHKVVSITLNGTDDELTTWGSDWLRTRIHNAVTACINTQPEPQ